MSENMSENMGEKKGDILADIIKLYFQTAVLKTQNTILRARNWAESTQIKYDVASIEKRIQKKIQDGVAAEEAVKIFEQYPDVQRVSSLMDLYAETKNPDILKKIEDMLSRFSPAQKLALARVSLQNIKQK